MNTNLEDIISKYKVESVPKVDKDRPKKFEIIKDMTGESEGEGKIDDYTSLFNDRYDRIEDILQKKMKKVVKIKNAKKKRFHGKDISVIGIVKNIRDTRNDNKFIEFEDPTGTFKVVYTDEEIKKEIEKIVEDEVIGIKGQVSDDGGIIFGDELIFPDVPRFDKNNSNKYEDIITGNKAVLISDTHIGSNLFSGEEWKKFVNWVNENKEIKYVLNAGDYVEGIGVYPGQDEELEIESIFDQNKAYSELVNQFRDDINIINIMGNHDPVRIAEPQPASIDQYKKHFDDNVYFTSNPSMINVEGVKILLYHGGSLQSLPDMIPGLKTEKPDEVMSHLLKKRHLSPFYGGKVRIAPEKKDFLVIDEVPDIFHTGHVHLIGQNEYNGVINVNTGCWQYQTDFQKRQNIDPDVGYAFVIDLDTKDCEMKKF